MYILKSVCVYCGGSYGGKEEYAKAAIDLSKALIKCEIDLVFGGVNSGLMKIVADEMLTQGRRVVGVIPKSIATKGVAHPNISETIIVDTMTERKAKMMQIADGFIALPGGLGTFSELFEALSFAQLGIMQKPCGILNVANFYNGIIEFLDNCVINGFIKKAHRDILRVSENPEELLDSFAKYEPIIVPK